MGSNKTGQKILREHKHTHKKREHVTVNPLLELELWVLLLLRELFVLHRVCVI